MEKTCFKCGEIKPLSEFYQHKEMSDGHVNKCKECNKDDVKRNRKLKINYYREYDRDRGCRQKGSYQKNYRKNNPRKYIAQTMVNNAIRSGVLKRSEFCSTCGDNEFKTHGHHDDYNYPLTVRWLCPACHKKWHDENGESPNGGIK